MAFELSTIKTILQQDEDISQIQIKKWYNENKTLPLGSNFGSIPYLLIVEYEKNGTLEKKSYFYKTYPNSGLYEFHLIFKFYKKELLMYTTVFPEMQKFIKESFLAKYYTGNDSDYLVLENISNYKMANKLEQLDLKHCELFFKNLAEFHAYSVILNNLSSISDEIKEESFYSQLSKYKHYEKLIIKAVEYFVDNVSSDFKQKYSKKLKDYRSNSIHGAGTEMKGTPETFKVLNHGDCWTPNMLFKYDQNTITGLKFVDFQLSCWANPVFDIIKFTISSMKYEVFENHFDALLKTYTESLNQILISQNLAPYKLENLYRDLDNTRYFKILAISIFLPTALSKPDNYFDPEDSFSGKVDVDDTNAKEVLSNSYYQSVLAKWLAYFTQKGLFDD